MQDEITESIKRVVKRIYNGFIYQLNSSLESRYRCLKVRRTGVARPITRSINGFERNGDEGRKFDVAANREAKSRLTQARLKKISETENRNQPGRPTGRPLPPFLGMILIHAQSS